MPKQDIREILLQEREGFSHFVSVRDEIASSTWLSPLSTGKALEMVTLIEILHQTQVLGGKYTIDQKYLLKPALFYLRNEIPVQHGAQAGHQATLENQYSLSDRFAAALTPKGNFEIKGSSFMIFREGNPLHVIWRAILGDDGYNERADLTIVKGTISVESFSDTIINVEHRDGKEFAKFKLAVKNSALIPVLEYETSANYEVKVVGIIECSVNKTKAHVDSQLQRYLKLWGTGSSKLSFLFLNGGKASGACLTGNVEMTELENELKNDSIGKVLRSFLQTLNS